MVLACSGKRRRVTHHATVTGIETTVKILTCSALVGLLGAVGLRLTWEEVKAALIRCRVAAVVLGNFIVVPALTIAAARGFGLKRDIAVAMVLLAASPFAPVVPIFARMARADLALAAGLTAGFPLASVLLTPVVVQAAMRVLTETDTLRFNLLASLATLAATITLPLAAGVLVRHRIPNFGRRLLRPMEVISEATGAASLAFVTVTEFSSIREPRLAGLARDGVGLRAFAADRLEAGRPGTQRAAGRGAGHQQPQHRPRVARRYSKLPRHPDRAGRGGERAAADRAGFVARRLVAFCRHPAACGVNVGPGWDPAPAGAAAGSGLRSEFRNGLG